ncbi:MAG: hypothetical protein CTY15_09150 [Methylocystis sp.]|nr:MAG: hypothetical protein CTY15_09150 [Methylocystis sp.]
MRPCALRFRGVLLVAALLIGGGAVGQELQLDPKALDTSGASSVSTKRGKGKKGADPAAAGTAQPAGKPAAGNPNRQFGELEGWSPGKAPPKPKGKQDDTAPGNTNMPVSVTPSGNMGTGFAF